MKILLVGEFSSFHRNLKAGLEKLGHEVHIAATGDGWKNIERDIDLGSNKNGLIGGIERRIKVFVKMWNLKGYDVIQFINPFCLFYIPFLTKLLISRLINNNLKCFLVAAGTDSFYLENAQKKMRYTPIDEWLHFDQKKKGHIYQSGRYIRFNKWFANVVDGIIPILYDYQVCYAGQSNLEECIPIPMNIDDIEYSPNVVSGKVIVFHGLNRYGFKGTRYIEEAFSRLTPKYKGHVDFIVKGHMPLDEYLQLLCSTNIVVDQALSFSSGVNAIYALAMGKIVLGGAEQCGLAPLGVTETPIINIEPSVDDICRKIELVLERQFEFEELGRKSREFAERHHNYKEVAEKYLKTWS